MRRIAVFLLLLAGIAVAGAPATAVAAPDRPSRPHTSRMVIRLSGDEYSDAQNNLVASPRRTRCPSPSGGPGQLGCWTWTAKGLGHGSYTLSQPMLQGSGLLWTFTYTDSHGDSLTGNLVEGFIPDPSPSDALTHANRYPATYTFTGGTGRFAGVTGTLTATATSTTVEPDPATGTAHSRFASTAKGNLRFPA
jgi:hypothetical protein